MRGRHVGTATIHGETAWMERAPGERGFVQAVECVEDPEADLSDLGDPGHVVLLSSFIDSDWIGLTLDAERVFGAPAKRRVTHRFYYECWCGCGSARVAHLHSDNVGVMECTATGKFNFYNADEFRRLYPGVATPCSH